MQLNDLTAELREGSDSNSTTKARGTEAQRSGTGPEALPSTGNVALEIGDKMKLKTFLQKQGAASYGTQIQVKTTCDLNGRRGRVLSFVTVRQSAAQGSTPNATSAVVYMWP